jgi:hypothetical protein
MDMIINQNKVP